MYFVLCFIVSFFFTTSVSGHYPEKYYSIQKDISVPPDYTNYVLPTNLKPTNYILTLTPDLSNHKFSGDISITFDVVQQTSSIVIHGNLNYITIQTTTIQLNDKSPITSTMTSDPKYELIYFTLNTPLSVQSNVNLHITYQGVLSDDMLGFYLTTYSTSGIQHLMGITQFESTYARRAFPCFDEPAYRAPFTIQILRAANQISMSNMGIVSSVPDTTTNLVLDTYDITPSIPTYLVAFGVGDLPSSSDGGKFRVFARQAVLSDASYVVKMGQSILDNIGSFVGVTYPLTKMDVVAVPDFDAGAMENWGLTTYREKYVLYNPSKNSLRDKFGVLSVVAHEFGHQWFGDLVTPSWWNCAWLNEAFATYFEYTVPNKLEPTWAIGSTMYVVGAVQYALGLDIGNPRPMTSDVWTPSQIDDSFDYVIYEKGGSVLRMIENFLTTAVWQQGLTNYLNTNKYGTGTPDGLFLALVNAAKSLNINGLSDTLVQWTTQPGYPVITITGSQGSTNTMTYTISQAPYALTNNAASYVWNVPMVYTTQSQPQFDPVKAQKHWHYPSDASTNTLTVQDIGWLIVNVDQIGYYRVNYDADNWNKLKSQLDSDYTVISEINRAQLIDDAFHLARSGHLDYATAFGLTNYLTKETALAPWNAFFVNMRFLINIYYNTATGNSLQEYARKTMDAPFNYLVSNVMDNVDSFLFTTTVSAGGLFSCEVGLPACETFAKNIFDEWRKDQSYVIPSYAKQAVLCTGLRMDQTVEAFLDVWNFYLSSDNAAEKLTIMYAMGCVTNTDAINVYLDAVTDPYVNNVRFQDRWIAFRSLAGYQTGVVPVLNYLAANYGRVSNALGSRLSAVISTISVLVTQDSQIAVVNSILNNNLVDAGLKDQLNAIVVPAIKQRLQWASSPQAASLSSWVDNYVKSSASTTFTNILLMLIPAVVVLLK